MKRMRMTGTLTPYFCQKALAEEVRRITSDMRFQAPKQEELEPLHVFEQYLPIPTRKDDDIPVGADTVDYVDGEEEEAIFKCPWCMVKISEGSVESINGYQTVTFAVCFGIYNPSDVNKGHEEILNLIQRVYGRFASDPLLNRQYTCEGNFEWSLSEEDTYPYFFGTIATSFKFLGFERLI